jgi:hypothetical protein
VAIAHGLRRGAALLDQPGPGEVVKEPAP